MRNMQLSRKNLVLKAHAYALNPKPYTLNPFSLMPTKLYRNPGRCSSAAEACVHSLRYATRLYRHYMGDCQNYGPFWGPYYNTGPNTGPNLGDPKRDHNFDNPPYWVLLGLYENNGKEHRNYRDYRVTVLLGLCEIMEKNIETIGIIG